MEVLIPEKQSSTENEDEFECHCADCIKEELDNQPNTIVIHDGPSNDSQATNSIPQLGNSFQESDNQSEQMENSEETGETSIVRW